MPSRDRPTRDRPSADEPAGDEPQRAAQVTFSKVNTRTVDMGTLSRLYNRGLSSEPSYEFSNGRKFTQQGDEEL